MFDPNYERKCQIIYMYARSHPSFNSNFIKSVIAFGEKHHYFTQKQKRAIDNIIEKWQMMF